MTEKSERERPTLKPASAIMARLKEAFDAEHALSQLRRAIAIPSVTGDEAAFATWLKDQLAAMGAESVNSRDFAPGRPNIWGLRRGRAGAETLLLIGHTDTVHVRG
jgi:acetylornithine deacetylase